VVDEALAVQALGDAGGVEQVDRRLLEHAGPHAGLDVGARARLEHDRLDALQVQQVGQQQPGRAGPHDPDLGLHHPSAVGLGEHALGDGEGRVGRRHPGVDRSVQQDLADLVGRQPVAQRGAHVHGDLLLGAQRHEHGQRDGAAHAPVEARPRPHLAPRAAA
jgi:hypothetical protein